MGCHWIPSWWPSGKGPGMAKEGISMATTGRNTFTILRRQEVEAETGYSRSTIYLRISQGLWTRPVNLGARAVGWPASEVEALNGARIAGLGNAQIRALVAKLEAQRRLAFQAH
jgi:prophage regulatory protein